MVTKLLSLALFSLAFQASVDGKVSIQVYYESLCPDSQVFISEQLNPTFQLLGAHLDLELIPFGFASFLPDQNGGWNFACQHGPKECSGNLHQACLIDALQDDPQKLMEVINCIMSDSQPHLATEKCMETSMITNPSFAEIDECHSSAKGQNLLHDFGVRTQNLDPSCFFIPWITFEDEWNEEDFEASLEDLKGLLCQKYLGNVSECSEETM